MKKILLFDTSYATCNMGDYIINESINREMRFLFEKSFIVRYPTHTPVRKFYQRIKPLQYPRKSDYKFLCGTNLFATDLFRPTPNFNINIFDTDVYSNSVAIGCGIGEVHDKKEFNTYTKYIYKKILSKKYIHSVRDLRTKQMLDRIGIRSINTGCPTLWMLTSDHCSKIPTQKSKSVVFTLTDYSKDEDKDKYLINILKKNYENVFFWIQGTGDLDYLRKIDDLSKVTLVYPDLENYRGLLSNRSVDYIGTRLHAGIYALQHFRRSIIISVDHRSNDMKKTFNLPCLERKKLQELSDIINSKMLIDIKIDEKAIQSWKSQFMD